MLTWNLFKIKRGQQRDTQALLSTASTSSLLPHPLGLSNHLHPFPSFSWNYQSTEVGQKQDDVIQPIYLINRQLDFVKWQNLSRPCWSKRQKSIHLDNIPIWQLLRRTEGQCLPGNQQSTDMSKLLTALEFTIKPRVNRIHSDRNVCSKTVFVILRTGAFSNAYSKLRKTHEFPCRESTQLTDWVLKSLAEQPGPGVGGQGMAVTAFTTGTSAWWSSKVGLARGLHFLS